MGFPKNAHAPALPFRYANKASRGHPSAHILMLLPHSQCLPIGKCLMQGCSRPEGEQVMAKDISLLAYLLFGSWLRTNFR
jgi:hypothetical protein